MLVISASNSFLFCISKKNYFFCICYNKQSLCMICFQFFLAENQRDDIFKSIGRIRQTICYQNGSFQSKNKIKSTDNIIYASSILICQDKLNDKSILMKFFQSIIFSIKLALMTALQNESAQQNTFQTITPPSNKALCLSSTISDKPTKQMSLLHRLINVRIVFIMFACFSKKKQSLKVPKPHQPHHPQLIPHNQFKSAQHHLLDPPPLKRFSPSDYAHEQPTTQPYTTNQPDYSEAAEHIDDIIKEQMQYQDDQNESREATAHFKRLSESSSNTSSPNYAIKHVKFENIHNQEELFIVRETASESIAFSLAQGSCDLGLSEILEEHQTPKERQQYTHSLIGIDSSNYNSDQLLSKNSSSRKHKFHSKKRRSKELEVSRFPSFSELDPEREQWALDTLISLENFNKGCLKIQQKIEDELEDGFLNETYEEAENSFYCDGADIVQQFTRSVISSIDVALPKRIYLKMSVEQKNQQDSKGYTPIQLLVTKSIKNKQFIEFTKQVLYDEEIGLDCRNPSGWTPLQQALFYRNIPLVTHIFKAGYSKKHQHFKQAISQISQLLETFPDFYMEIDVKVDSFLPLVGSLTPSDTLKIRKLGNRVKLDYSLVGYQFPSCKRRQMGILFDGHNILAVNNSKLIYCDLLQPLDHQEMILMVQDLLIGQIRRGEPIVHEVKISKSLSLFQNEIVEKIGVSQAVKHSLEICYTSTAEKRKPQPQSSLDSLDYVDNYQKYRDRVEKVVIKDKNKNKKVDLQLWLGSGFGLKLTQLISILQLLGMGNNLVAEWASFLKRTIGTKLEQAGTFPIKIDIPLNYSLFFNIEFKNFYALEKNADPIELPESLNRVSRKQFQGILESRQKRALFLQAYT